MAKNTLDAEQKKALRDHGFVIDELPEGALAKQPKATYYDKTGKAYPNLPMDAYSLRRYLSRGLSPWPPGATAKEAAVAVMVEEQEPEPEPSAQEKVYVCIFCEREITSKIGLISHMRTHRPKEETPGEQEEDQGG